MAPPSRERRFISWSLTEGANPYGVAKYHGTSMTMIDAHYGKWIPAKGLDQAVLRALDEGENRDLDRDLLAVNDEKPGGPGVLECEEGDLNPRKGLISGWTI